ncbi:MAG: OB-fold nucleic acid binding domain-containing protein [Actinomycetota bacterium]
MGWLSRLLHRARQSDEDRLAEEIRDWAEDIPGTRRIDSCPNRERVRVTGIVRRLTVRPQDGSTLLEAVITDGTGEMAAVWTGRDHIEGLHLGTRVILEGLLAEQRHARPRMVNPDFEFA